MWKSGKLNFAIVVFFCAGAMSGFVAYGKESAETIETGTGAGTQDTGAGMGATDTGIGIQATDTGTGTRLEEKKFGAVATGWVDPYHVETGDGDDGAAAIEKQDLSGAAAAADFILTVDDSGSKGDKNRTFFIRRFSSDKLGDDATAKNFVLSTAEYRDLEAATYDGVEWFYVTTSLTGIDSGKDIFNRTFRFKLLKGMSATAPSDEEWVNLRAALLEAMKTKLTAYDGWHDRIKDEDGKAGGLNIEGMAWEKTGSRLLLGLRSPLYGAKFRTEEPTGTRPSTILDEGDAIIAFVTDPFGTTPSFEFRTLALDNRGIRGMEYIEALDGYVIITGTVPTGSGYGLFLWDGTNEPVSLSKELAAFTGLCRPESVVQATEGEKKYLIIFSEESTCCHRVKDPANVKYTWLKAEIK